MQKIYENIDYLEIQLRGQNIYNILSGLVENSPTYYIGDYSINLRESFRDGMYKIYDVSFKDGFFLNRDINIASINWIKNNDMSKKGIYLTFPGLPFKNYGLNIVYDFLENINFDYKKYKFNVFRLDYCVDFEEMTVESILKTLYTEKLSFSSFPIRFDPKTQKPTWFSLPFTEDILRVYNKKLDISDRNTFKNIPGYKEYLENDKPITRIEIQLNRNKFKKKIVNDLESLFDYGRNSLGRKLNKYFNTQFVVKNIVFKKDINYLDQSYKKEFEFSKKMFQAYYDKLYANPYGFKWLKRKIFDLEFSLNGDIYK